jgi:hypothetical protein
MGEPETQVQWHQSMMGFDAGQSGIVLGSQVWHCSGQQAGP